MADTLAPATDRTSDPLFTRVMTAIRDSDPSSLDGTLRAILEDSPVPAMAAHLTDCGCPEGEAIPRVLAEMAAAQAEAVRVMSLAGFAQNPGPF